MTEAPGPSLEELDEISRNNVIVQRMVGDGLSFDRVTYIKLFYEDKVPSPWTQVHESRLPPVFQRDDNEAQVREALDRLGEAIGVVYSGEVPR